MLRAATAHKIGRLSSFQDHFAFGLITAHKICQLCHSFITISALNRVWLREVRGHKMILLARDGTTRRGEKDRGDEKVVDGSGGGGGQKEQAAFEDSCQVWRPQA